MHVSKIAHERVEDIHDYVEEDQEIDVWVSCSIIDSPGSPCTKRG